jgi:hypothetical protein
MANATQAQKDYYAKNKADAKVKEDKALYELTGSRGDAARKGMEEGRMDAMGTAYKKGGKVKKFNDGGMSLEEKYPEAKITRAGPQPKPEEYSANRIKVDDLFDSKKEKGNRSDLRTLAPYERKAEKMDKGARGGAGSGSGGAAELKSLLNPRAMKKGGMVKSASARADGCAIRGKTRA